MLSGSTTKTENSGAKDVFFHRLVRSVSRKDGNAASFVVDQGSEHALSLTKTQSATSLSSQASQKRMFGVADRIKRLNQDLPLKLRRNSKSEPASPRVTSLEVENTNISSRHTTAGHGKMLSMVDERVEDSQATTSGRQSPSPATLARRLRDLIDPLPFPSFSYPIKPPKLPPRDKKGRPIPPQPSISIKDPKLIELLSSATFMNGTRSSDTSRPSVWDILEGLSVPPHSFPEEESTGQEDEGGDNQSPVDDPPDYASISSVMVYSPLIPSKDDIVELGELVPVSIGEEAIYDAAANTSWTSVWPLSLLPSWPRSTTQAAVVVEAPFRDAFPEDILVHSNVTTVDGSGRKFIVKTTSAWVPSTTKVSFQAMWWGYRLWLPPPVMAVLGDGSLEASKRASMIATALAWFFNNLPINLFPPQVRPALLLMQRIVPYLGYIATFISWSWSTIKSYDVGHGVTLNATWLLPFALIPRTWNDKDVPKSPTQNPPTTIPSTSPKTSPSLPSQSPVNTPTSPSQSPPATSIGAGASILSPAVSVPDTPGSPSISLPMSSTQKIFALSTPPVPMPRTPVPAVSTLGETLLQAPVLRSIPLPNESSETLDVMNKARKEKKTNPFFRRTGK